MTRLGHGMCWVLAVASAVGYAPPAAAEAAWSPHLHLALGVMAGGGSGTGQDREPYVGLSLDVGGVLVRPAATGSRRWVTGLVLRVRAMDEASFDGAYGAGYEDAVLAVRAGVERGPWFVVADLGPLISQRTFDGRTEEGFGEPGEPRIEYGFETRLALGYANRKRTLAVSFGPHVVVHYDSRRWEHAGDGEITRSFIGGVVDVSVRY